MNSHSSRFFFLFLIFTCFSLELVAGAGASSKRNKYRTDTPSEESINPELWIFESSQSDCDLGGCAVETAADKLFRCEHLFHGRCLSVYAPRGSGPFSHCPLCGARAIESPVMSCKEADARRPERVAAGATVSMVHNPLLERLRAEETVCPGTPRPGSSRGSMVERGRARGMCRMGLGGKSLAKRTSKTSMFHRNLQDAALKSRSTEAISKVACEFRAMGASMVYFLMLKRGGLKPILIRIIEECDPEILEAVLNEAEEMGECFWFLVNWRSTQGRSLLDYTRELVRLGSRGKEMGEILKRYGAVDE